ncbi:MAG: hypothetical protein P8Y68_01315 [Anaerolineales bacterium]
MNQLKVFLEIGKKKTFAGAVDWPGWCRSGKDEINAMQSLLDYAPRYAQVLAGSGLDFNPPDDIADLVVVERQPGNATTDFGAPDAILSSDQAEVNQTETGFFQEVLQGCWRIFDQAALTARGKELRSGPRGGGRDLDKIIHHLIEGDRAYLRRLAWTFSRDAEAPPEEELARIHAAILDALQAAQRGDLPTEGPRGGKIWPVRFFVRRAAWHTLDHAWEIQDRML